MKNLPYEIWSHEAAGRFDPYLRLDYKARPGGPGVRARWFDTETEVLVTRSSDLSSVDSTVLVAMMRAFVEENSAIEDHSAVADYAARRARAYALWRDSRLPALLDRLDAAASAASRLSMRPPIVPEVLEPAVRVRLMSADDIDELMHYEAAEASTPTSSTASRDRGPAIR